MFFCSIGVPNVFHALCQNSTLGTTFFINCDFNDDSDAPATGVIISLSGIIQDKHMSFEVIPVKDITYPSIITVDLVHVVTGVYTLTLTAVNMLGNFTVINSTYIIVGK